MNEREKAYALYNWLTTAEMAKAIRRSDDFVLARVTAPDAQGFQFTEVLRDSAGYLFHPQEVQRYIEAHKLPQAS